MNINRFSKILHNRTFPTFQYPSIHSTIFFSDSSDRQSSYSSKPTIPTPVSTNKQSHSSSSKEDVSSAASRFRRAESEDQTLSTSFRLPSLDKTIFKYFNCLY